MKAQMSTMSIGIEDDEDEEFEIADGTTDVAVIVPPEILYKSYYSDCGIAGLCDAICDADESPKVGAIIIKGSCWGGDEGSAQKLNDCILKCQKPIFWWVDYGGVCSAGYLGASACKKVYASRMNDRVGSIGSYFTYYVRGTEAGKYGDYVDVYSSLSPEKNLESRDAAKGDFKAAIKLADQITTWFHAAIKTNRPQITTTDSADPYKGGTFLASDGLALNLVDGVKTFEDVVKEAAKEGAKFLTQNKTDMFGYLKATKLAALKGVDVANLTDEQLTAANEDLSQLGIQGVVLVRESEVESAITGAGQLQTEVNQQKTLVQQLQASLTAKDAEIARLGQQPGETPTATQLVKKEETIDGAPKVALLKSGLPMTQTDIELAELRQKAGFVTA